jgi:hypothetical protein
MLRAKVKEAITKAAEQEKDLDMLEADFVIRCNDKFHKVCDKVRGKQGRLDSERIFFDWNEWLRKEVKKRKSKEYGSQPSGSGR